MCLAVVSPVCVRAALPFSSCLCSQCFAEGRPEASAIAAMSIKFAHVDGLSEELAAVVGLYEAADLSLDDIDMSPLEESVGRVGGEAAQASDDEVETDEPIDLIDR